MPRTPFIKKETLGWSIGNAYYRVRRKKIALLLYIIDSLGFLFFSFKKRRSPAAPQSILVIQLDHIGDMLLCTPLIAAIKQAFPDARIALLIRELADPIAKAIDGVDEILHLHTPWLSREKSLGWAGVAGFCLQRFRKYDLSFEVHGEARNIFVAWLLSRFRVGLGVRGGGFLLNRNVPWVKEYSMHIIEVQAKLLHAVAPAVPFQAKPIFQIPAESEERALSLLHGRGLKGKEYLLIQMSVGETNREWPLHYWKILVSALLKKGFSIICADQDASKQAFIAEGLEPKQQLHFFNVSLLEYAGFVKFAQCVISVETFCNHLAACFNTPALALYSGVTFTAEWGPLSDEKVVLQDTACSLYPCALRKCPFGYPSPCMRAISAESALEGLAKLIGRQQHEQ